VQYLQNLVTNNIEQHSHFHNTIRRHSAYVSQPRGVGVPTLMATVELCESSSLWECVCEWRCKRHRWWARHASCELSLDCEPPRSADVRTVKRARFAV